MTIISVPLSKLIPSTANVRKTGGSIDDLSASIAAHGLIQSLTVRAADGGRFEVVAGSRRLAALKRLAKEKRILKSYPVPCRLLDGEDAAEISLAENQIRQAMHPADQFDAFKALFDGGMPCADIAARFGVTERLVEQRLKLASVSPALFALYRADELTLEQLMAFTLTDDHQRQEAVWQSLADSYDQNPYTIRRRLLETKVAGGDPRALLIGEEAYLAAGGSITRDLFSDTGEGLFEDAALLDRLVFERLEEAALPVRAEGWAWVEIHPQLPYGAYHAFSPDMRDLTGEEQAELDRLTAEYDDLSADEENEECCRAIDYRLDEIEQARHVYSEEAKAAQGAVVYLDRSGVIGTLRGYGRVDTAQRSAPSGAAADKPVKPKPEMSASLLEDLTAQRTQALRAALSLDHRVALDALLHALAIGILYHRPDLSCLQIAARTHYPRMSSPELADTDAAKLLDGQRQEYEQALPEEPGQLWDWLRQADQLAKFDLLAFLTAATLNAVQQNGATPHVSADQLHEALALDMAHYWTPTAENYLSRIPAAKVLEAVREAVSLEAASSLNGLKKAVLVKKAERKLAGTRWLPNALRFPGQPIIPSPEEEPLERAVA